MSDNEEGGAVRTGGKLLGLILLFLLVLLVLFPLAGLSTLPSGATHRAISKAMHVTPQPLTNETPPQWGNAYWQDKAATREARDAQYRKGK